MDKVTIKTSSSTVEGYCKPHYESIVKAFERNFSERDESGASLSLSIAGETVVDVWGGHVAEDKKTPWEENTLSVVFSCTKAATALCAHLLCDRGEMSLHDPVAKYWPAFARGGKKDTTLAMMLNHSAAVPAFRETLKPGAYYDWEYMVERLEKEEPFWEPGTRNGYHMVSFGWTVGEIIRRVTGQSLGEFFRKEVAEPLGLDFFIGLPESEEARVSHMIPFLPGADGPVTDFTYALLNEPTSISHLSFMNSGGYQVDSREAHAAEIGGAGGISNARSLAKMYVPLANDGEHRSGRLISCETVQRMSQPCAITGRDATLLIPSRFAFGFMVTMDNRHRPQGDIESVILGQNAFGHVGAGGSLGFADPDCRLAFAYTMNRMGAGLLLNERGQSLVDATYKTLGYRDNKPGFWRL